MKHKLRKYPPLAIGVGALVVATVLLVAWPPIAEEPAWLERMNEFEHFVLHVTFGMTGLIIGLSVFAVSLWSILRMREPNLRAEVIPGVLRGDREARLRQGHLVAIVGTVLLGLTVVLAKRHLIEPLWLTNLTPFQHFLFHLGIGVGGAILGFSALAAFSWLLLEIREPRVGRNPALRSSGDEEHAHVNRGPLTSSGDHLIL